MSITANQPTAEPAIPFTCLPTWIAKEFGVRAPHISSVHRWRLSGARGVQLPTFLCGARRYVRPQDVRAFLAELNK